LAAGEIKTEILSSVKHAQAKDQKSRIGPDITAKAAESPPSSDSDSSTDGESSAESNSDEESAETMHQETLNDVRNDLTHFILNVFAVMILFKLGIAALTEIAETRFAHIFVCLRSAERHDLRTSRLLPPGTR
jgi:hypothetical protein